MNLFLWFRDCSPILEKEIADRVQMMGDKFIAASMVGQVPGHESQAFFQRRLGFASTLYYRVLESILAKEQTTDLMVHNLKLPSFLLDSKI